MPYFKPDINKFRRRLKEFRSNTLDRTAEKLGVGKRTYQDWINTKIEKWPSVDNLIKIANTYNVTTDYILGISDYTTPENHDIGEKIGLSDEAIQKLQDMKKDGQETALKIISDMLVMDDFDKILLQMLDLYTHATAQKELTSLTSAIPMDQVKDVIGKIDYSKDSKEKDLIEWYLKECKEKLEYLDKSDQFLKATYADISRLSWNLAESYYNNKSKP